MSEKQEIMVVPRELPLTHDVSFINWTNVHQHLGAFDTMFRWISRRIAEESAEWVQPIPVALVKDQHDRYCILRRTRETRSDLQGRLTLVVGGHVERSSGLTGFMGLLEDTLHRELYEELGILPTNPLRPIGIVIDPTSQLSSRHLAFLFEVTVKDPISVQAPEEFSNRSKYSGQFLSVDELTLHYTRLDPWSKSVLEDYLNPSLGYDKWRQRLLPIEGDLGTALRKRSPAPTEHQEEPDNIPKRIGAWTARKLEYLDYYIQAYRTVTKKAPQTYYLDLFAGSGDCVLNKTGWPVEGSPWRAMNAVPAFTKYLFVEKNHKLADHLRQRVSQAGFINVDVFEGDCNGPTLDEVLELVPRKALSFSFLDPSGLQLHWQTVQKLANHRLGPLKMELLILYPYDMVIKRWMRQPHMASALTAIYGDESWREALTESDSLGEDERQRRERFVELYCGKFKGLGYKYVVPYGPLGEGRRYYYNVVFASDQPIGAGIMDDVWRKARPMPGELEFVALKRPKVKNHV